MNTITNVLTFEQFLNFEGESISVIPYPIYSNPATRPYTTLNN
ncbi:MAG: hypothetical protein RLP02_24945 [Coleofasciculus sp. C2-GNP5-27]